MRASELVTRWMGVTPSLNHSTCVQTSNGYFIGHQAPNASEVIEYLGIPYAQPPVGDLRFAAPVAYQGNVTDIFNASQHVRLPDKVFLHAEQG